MSTAHRPTWAPAQARDAGSGSRVISVRDVASNTKLKFRQPGQGTASEVSRRDLKAELAKAERAAINKRKGITEVEDDLEQSATSAPLGATDAATSAAGTTDQDEQAAKRRKLIEEAVELDRDDDSEEEEGEAPKSNGANGKTDLKGKGKAVAVGNDDDDDEDADDSDDDSSDEEEDDEDETAELLRELEKIKRERAEERERQERERASSDAISAEEQAALGNPLLNLQAALSGNKSLNSPGGYSSTGSSAGSFAVKKRWDDDVIFKNQAVKSDEPKKEFVNDLIRTQFHRRFLQRYIA